MKVNKMRVFQNNLQGFPARILREPGSQVPRKYPTLASAHTIFVPTYSNRNGGKSEQHLKCDKAKNNSAENMTFFYIRKIKKQSTRKYHIFLY